MWRQFILLTCLSVFLCPFTLQFFFKFLYFYLMFWARNTHTAGTFVTIPSSSQLGVTETTKKTTQLCLQQFALLFSWTAVLFFYVSRLNCDFLFLFTTHGVLHKTTGCKIQDHGHLKRLFTSVCYLLGLCKSISEHGLKQSWPGRHLFLFYFSTGVCIDEL